MFLRILEYLKNVKKITILIIFLNYWRSGWLAIFGEKKSAPSSKFNRMIKITSPAFVQGQTIPKKYTCDGEDINPPLVVEGVPPEAKSLVLIVDDPDAPVGAWNHWLVFNIDPSIKEIGENSVPQDSALGTNDFGKLQYGGPCPPSGVHRYFFRLYALDTIINIPQGTERSALEKAMENHILDQGELMGKYGR